MPRALPEVSGFGSITENVGETENRGFEMTLETVNFQTKDFSWTTSLQFATNKEQIVKLASGQKEDTANMWFVGHPVDTHYNYVSTKYVWGYSKEDMAEMAKFNANGHSYKPGDLRFVDKMVIIKLTLQTVTSSDKKCQSGRQVWAILSAIKTSISMYLCMACSVILSIVIQERHMTVA